MNKLKNGFTLVELLITIAIMVGLVAVVLPQLKSFDRGKSLQEAAAQLQTHLRVAQNNASSGVVCTPGSPASSWHILFNYDAEAGQFYYHLVSSCSGVGVYPAPAQRYNLPVGVSISKITFYTSADTIWCSVAFGESNKLIDNEYRVNFDNISANINFEGGADCTPGQSDRMALTLSLDSNPTEMIDVTIKKGGSIFIGLPPAP